MACAGWTSQGLLALEILPVFYGWKKKTKTGTFTDKDMGGLGTSEPVSRSGVLSPPDTRKPQRRS
jgi:hypothetical protein